MPAIPPRPIALVGMMGAGKTSVGRALAARLGWRFVDSDDDVARAAGLSIVELFEREGEAAFRQRERRIVDDVLDGSPLVLATGGGAMADPGTRELLLERAVTIWLRATPEVLAQRLEGSTDRPLLDGGNRIGVLRDLLAGREANYASASVHFATDDAEVDQVVTRLLAIVAA